MAGVKQFDVDAALGRVMGVFWERGFEATSIDDLVTATGLKRGSLYNAFGDKEGMFLAAVRRYQSLAEGPMLEALSEPDPRKALRRLFDAQLAHLEGQDSPLGCLVVNASTERGAAADAVGRALRESLARMEDALYELLLAAQARGQLAAGADLRALARFFLGTSRAMSLMFRTTGELAYARDMARCALAVLDAPPGPKRA
jgi:TetR/AcrR family transcriptional repressor of nem operon